MKTQKTFKNGLGQACEVIRTKNQFILVRREYTHDRYTFDVYCNDRPTQAIAIGYKRKAEMFERVIKHAALYL